MHHEPPKSVFPREGELPHQKGIEAMEDGESLERHIRALIRVMVSPPINTVGLKGISRCDDSMRPICGAGLLRLTPHLDHQCRIGGEHI